MIISKEFKDIKVIRNKRFIYFFKFELYKKR